MTEQEMKDYMMKFGGSLHPQLLGIITELHNKIQELTLRMDASKELTKPKAAKHTQGK